MKRSILFAVALAVVSVRRSAAQGDIAVLTDSGSIGGFKLINMEIAAGIETIEITGVPNTKEQLNTVNGVSVARERVTFH
jgi:hypothetical protein